MDFDNKRKRQTQSCDRCKFKKRKCDGQMPCGNCVKANTECTMLIEQKKRGPKRQKGQTESPPPAPASSSAHSSQQQTVEPNLPSSNIFSQYNNLEFDTDFILNLQEDPFAVPVYLQSQKKPQQTPLQIDPEVLNLYTQLNPKLSIQSDLDAFLQSTIAGQQENGPANLTIPELPGIPSSFFMHLISMFFTYYHSSFPVFQENHFMEYLVPENKHHPMLLNTIYAIGCQYSRSAYLYQSPFYTPQKAFEFFINRALAATPPPEVWSSEASDSLAICQASLLLSSCDFKTQKSYTWMMVGMAVRLCQKFELHVPFVEHDFFSTTNGIPKFHIKATNQERQRVWWCTLLTDLFLTISTGSDLMINESDYFDSFVAPTVRSRMFKNPLSVNLTIKNQDKPLVNGQDKDKWMPFFSGFPSDTIFGASDINSEAWLKQSVGFFQIGHLFSNWNDLSFVVQLSFLTRRAIRHAKSVHVGSNSLTITAASLYKLVEQPFDIHAIHDSLITWFENLPIELRLWKSLDVVMMKDINAIHSQSVLKEGMRLSTTAVITNLLFFSTLAILHQTKCVDTLQPRFKISSFLGSPIHESKDMVKLAYRGLCYLLKRVYGQFMPPTLTYIPPSEIVGSTAVSALIMPIATAMLTQTQYLTQLLSPKNSIQDSTGIDSLESTVLPCLENLGQVWPVAYSHATHLRHLMEKIQLNNSGFVMESFIPPAVLEPQPVFEQTQDQEKSWYDLRNEFEDEFLL